MTKKEEADKSKAIDEGHDNALAARRARLRTSLTKQSISSSSQSEIKTQSGKGGDEEPSNSGNSRSNDHKIEEQLSRVLATAGFIADERNKVQTETLAILSHINQALNSCAAHLVSLQNVANKQIEELKSIADALQSRPTFEAQQSLNPLMESLTAAIEPMKAMGELISVLDRLVSVNEQKEQIKEQDKFSGEDKTLAEESIFDNDRQLELIKREDELSQLLAEKDEQIENIRLQLDSQWQELTVQCEELKSALQMRENILQEKELELNKKANELAAKDSENQLLKAQMEELKDKAKEMMTDLQRQLTKKQEEEVVKKEQEEMANQAIKQEKQAHQSGFFDFVGAGAPKENIFTTKIPQLFQEEETAVLNQSDTANAPIVQSNISPAMPVAMNTEVGFGNDSQIPNQSSASFVSAAGSYGSGVRAQVFEVIVRQALAGTQWREICAVPMQSNNISPQEVEAEVKRRQALLKK